MAFSEIFDVFALILELAGWALRIPGWLVMKIALPGKETSALLEYSLGLVVWVGVIGTVMAVRG